MGFSHSALIWAIIVLWSMMHLRQTIKLHFAKPLKGYNLDKTLWQTRWIPKNSPRRWIPPEQDGSTLTGQSVANLWLIVFQARAHFESLGQHLGKLGDDMKMGHRVIDLTRPEDMEGESLDSFYTILSSIPHTWHEIVWAFAWASKTVWLSSLWTL